jgi:hypothetical protein
MIYEHPNFGKLNLSELEDYYKSSIEFEMNYLLVIKYNNKLKISEITVES